MKKKVFALALVASMAMASMPVMAATSPTASAVASSAVTSSSSKKSSSKTDENRSYTPSAPASTASDWTSSSSYVPGVPSSVSAAAAQEGKTVGEYMNNAVSEVPGLASATPLAQGGHVIINGAPSNQTFSVLKPVLAVVNSAKAQAAALGGNVLNVAVVKASVSFNTATVNFYTKGIKAGQNIKVYQYVNGAWVEVEVTEIREDHVVVNMTSLGTLAFIELPAAQ